MCFFIHFTIFFKKENRNIYILVYQIYKVDNDYCRGGLIMKQVINANEYEFEIRRVPRPFGGYGVYLNHESFSCERMLCERWSISECKNWIFSHFIGKKGTKFNINIIESKPQVIEVEG